MTTAMMPAMVPAMAIILSLDKPLLLLLEAVSVFVGREAVVEGWEWLGVLPGVAILWKKK